MTPREKTPTMRDVAGKVGVSVQTVSAVVNQKPGITLETRERVLAAIEQLGYRPFSVARSLRTRRTHTIALIVPDIANPSFASIAGAAENIAHSYGYSLVIYNTHSSLEREASYIRTATERWVDGVLFVIAQDQMGGLDSLQAAGIPYVAIDRIPQGYEGPSVTLDNIKAGILATEHLISLGHRQLAHLSGPLNLRLGRERRDGFLKALQDQGLRGGLVVNSTGWTCEEGYQAMKALLLNDPVPTAVFAASDRIAIGAMQAAHEAGLTIPGDISIVGLDDIEVAAYQNPPLTTIRQSFPELATLGMHTLLAILKGEGLDQEQIVLEPALVLRASTAPMGYEGEKE